MSDLERYIEQFSEPQDELLRELERETHLHVRNPQMLSGSIQGKFLEMVVRMIKPRNVLEIGTFTGYSALSIAAGLEDNAILDTIEADDELESFAAQFFTRTPHGHKIRQHIGSALDILPTLGKVYDLVFIDGGKREYSAYYQLLLEHHLIKSGSWIFADNVLWYGKVEEIAGQVRNDISLLDPQTAAIAEFNELVRNDRRVENIILPVRDGINVIRVK